MEKKKKKLVSRWALPRRLYDWVLSFSHSRHATLALGFLSFIESSCFPIAPDVLQIPLTLERPKLAWYYATVSMVGSVLGGMFGYFIGMELWDLTSDFFFRHIIDPKVFDQIDALYHRWSFWAVLIAAFTPIPYKVFTIAAGVFRVPFGWFVLASILGRSARFFLLALLLHWKGKRIKELIDRHFNILTIVLTLLLIGFFFLVKYEF